MTNPNRVIVLKPGEEIPNGFEDAEDVDVTSHAESPLSPFLIGGTHASDANSQRPGTWFRNFENMWQYSKVYRVLGHVGEDGMPSPEWYKWYEEGAERRHAVRYPAGRDAKPEYLMWQGRKLGYVTARKLVYIPKYMERVGANSKAAAEFKRLYDILKRDNKLILRDFDCYPITRVYNWQALVDDPYRRFGHGFVLAHALEHGSTRAYVRLIV